MQKVRIKIRMTGGTIIEVSVPGHLADVMRGSVTVVSKAGTGNPEVIKIILVPLLFRSYPMLRLAERAHRDRNAAFKPLGPTAILDLTTARVRTLLGSLGELRQ
jgi:hypothetical protein